VKKLSPDLSSLKHIYWGLLGVKNTNIEDLVSFARQQTRDLVALEEGKSVVSPVC
jgi:hypothetical protein